MVVLIAVLSGAIVFGSGLVADTRLRTAAALVVNGIRLGLTRANSTGHPARLVFDFDEQRVILEETSSLKMLREKGDSKTGGAEAATEAEKAAVEEAERILDGPKAERASFQPVKQFGFDGSDASSGRELGSGIAYRMVQTEHDDVAVTGGRAYLYFWPGGRTETAVIQLERSTDDAVTVSVSALTGRAHIQRGEVALPEPRSDGQYSEREEE